MLLEAVIRPRCVKNKKRKEKGYKSPRSTPPLNREEKEEITRGTVSASFRESNEGPEFVRTARDPLNETSIGVVGGSVARRAGTFRSRDDRDN